MKKVTPHTAPTSPHDPSELAQLGMPDASSGQALGTRRAYRRPEVTKRRSLSQATLVSGGGTGGSLAGGMI